MSATDIPEFPLRDLLGFTVEQDDGRAVAVVDVDSRHLNPHGSVHGGVTYTLLDTAMGAAAMSAAQGHWVTTVEITTRYLKACSGGRISAVAHVRRAGRRIIHLDATVTTDDGDEIVAASGVFAVIPAG